MNFKTPSMLPRKKRPNIVVKHFEFNEQEKFSSIIANFEKLQEASENGLTPYSSYKVDDNSITLERPFVEGKSLNEFLVDKTRLTPTEVYQLAMSIMSIIYRLHSFGFILHNLKPSNIIIHSTGEVTFVDCGCDIIYMENNIKNPDPIKVLFAGPEQFNEQHSLNSEKHDIWCLGLVICYMFFGCYPCDTSSISSVRDQLVNLRDNLQFPPEIDNEFKDLLSTMLNRNPDQRPNSSDILQTLSGITVPDQFYSPFIFKRSNSFCHKNGIDDTVSASHLSKKDKPTKFQRSLKGKTINSLTDVTVESQILFASIQDKVRKRSNSLSFSDFAEFGFEIF